MICLFAALDRINVVLVFLLYGLVIVVFYLIPSHTYKSYKKYHEKKKRRLAKEKAEDKFYRFNPSKERNTEINMFENIIHFETDIQDIRVNTGTLVIKVSSLLENLPFKFKLAIKPFSTDLFFLDELKYFESEGMLIIGSENEQTKSALLATKALGEAAQAIKDEPKTTYLYTSGFSVDQSENAFEFNGRFDDQNEFQLRIEHKAFRLKIRAPLSSINNKLNFGDLESLDLR